MTTPWRRIAGEFRAQLVKAGFTADEFNNISPETRLELLYKFEKKNQQQQVLEKKNQQQQVLEQLEEGNFYKNAKLPKSLLREHGLADYIRAADAQVDSLHTKQLVEYLLESQDNGESDDSFMLVGTERTITKNPNLFVSIITSSGTGKTQLAATASLNYQKEATTIYLLCSRGDQRFYKPHITQSASIFRREISKFLEILQFGNDEKITATIIKNWARKSDDGTSLFVHILYRLLVDDGDHSPPEKVHLRYLKQKIAGKKFLVFLDEVPQKGTDKFNQVSCLRDTLRYLGIAPILMSTHTGAQEYVSEASRSSSASWMRIISKLPPYRPYPITKDIFTLPSERPLVLGLVSGMSGAATVPEVVSGIREYLQKAKPQAWTKDPALQLVQLFCTDIEIERRVFAVVHKLVGHHFGCLQQSNVGTKFGARSYSSAEASLFAENLSVAPVSAQCEPLLYLALVTWDKNMLEGKLGRRQALFPLVNKAEEAITVREAYNLCKSHFTPKAQCVNQQAQKADGDLLEVLVHASLNLASMKTSAEKEKYLAGVPMNEYLPVVRKLMLPGKFDSIPCPPNFFKQLEIDWMTVPALGGFDSGLPPDLASATNSLIGFLTRPKDQERVDGYIYNTSEGGEKRSDTPCISIECKNYSDGVGANVLKNVFTRIKSSIKFSLVFVSSCKGNIFQGTNLDSLKEKCFKKNFGSSLNDISVLRWEENKDPAFLKIGGTDFKATRKTKLLVVIIEVGVVDTNTFGYGCGKRKRNEEWDYQACANLPWNIES